MKIPLLILCFAVCTTGAIAQNITKVTTLAVQSGQTNNLGIVTHGNATNYITLAAGEAARVSSVQHVTQGAEETNYAEFWYIRDRWYWTAYNATVVEGPVTFVIELTADSNSAARLTLERWKVSKK